MEITLPTLLIVVPLLGALVASLLGSRAASAHTILVTGVVQLALILAGVLALGGHGFESLDLTQTTSWIDVWNVEYSVHVNAVSLGLVALVTVVSMCASAFAWHADRERPGAFHALMWISTAALCGLFLARDLVFFYVCFELMLIPMILLVAGWGGTDRVRAALTMTIYTLLGSLLMLVGVVAVGAKTGTYDLAEIAQMAATTPKIFGWWVFASFLLAFAIKAPLVPFHGWLPLTYRTAPPEVSAMLSGVISKAGAVGFLYVLLPLFPHYMHGTWGKVVIWMGIAGIVYGSIAAFRQIDARGVVAYSSLAQMGLIVLGLSVLGDGISQGIAGAYFQTINHGIISATLFLLVGMVERRAGTDRLMELGGLAWGRPVFTSLVMVALLCAVAVPGSNAFASELLIFLGAWRVVWWYAAVASVGVVLAAMYGLRVLSAVLHTPASVDEDPANVAVDSAPVRARFGGDIGWREGLAIVPLIVAMLVLSVWPNALKNSMNQRMVKIQAQAVPEQAGAK
jgi:NADH-quinone oxidoreductase subunit M